MFWPAKKTAYIVTLLKSSATFICISVVKINK